MKNKPSGSSSKSSKGGLFSNKPVPEQAQTLAQRFLNFFGFGKPQKTPNKGKSNRSRKSTQKHPITNERLFIGNLAYSVKEQNLEEFFASAGKVASAEIARNRQTRRSKGFGFVTMASVEEAEIAATKLDGASFNGREISVTGAKNESRKQDSGGKSKPPKKSPRKSPKSESRSDSRPAKGKGRKERDRDGRKSKRPPAIEPMPVEVVSTNLLVMKNLGEDFDKGELDHLFAGVATISEAKISEGKAEIEMASVEDAQNAVKLLDGKDYMGKTLSLSGQTAEG